MRRAPTSAARVGHALADAALRALGLAAYLFPVYLVYLTVALLRRDTEELGGARLAGAGLLVLRRWRRSAASLTGGRPGRARRRVARRLLATALARSRRRAGGAPGSSLVLLALAIVLATGVSVIALATRFGAWAVDARREGARTAGRRCIRRRGPTASARAAPARGATAAWCGDRSCSTTPSRTTTSAWSLGGPRRRPSSASPSASRSRRAGEEAQAELQEELFAEDHYRLPTLTLLDAPQRTAQPIDEATLLTSSRILETKLADFGVAGKVVAVRPGPVITTFEFEPAPGVKVNRIVSLADDLTMALRAASVRILAPIPGQAGRRHRGVEPAAREGLHPRADGERRVSPARESKLTLALGKDTTGNAVVADLGRMPHLLIAGATGTGKSVSMNAMIMSILFKASPRDVRFIMIDPKMLELSIYEDIPHLLVPVVTDPKKAAAALNNMIREMEERYRLLHDKGVRNIDSYNRLIARGGGGGGREAEAERRPRTRSPPRGRAEEADDTVEVPTVRRCRRAAALRHRHLPRIVVIIDELADLMMTVGREIEESITRLAQKARAAGIHLILATQRPSVDVITGLIKANFPARISFQVTSRTDSRTILDAIGAERLLGQGDMLFLPPGHGARAAPARRLRLRRRTSTASSTSSSARRSRATRWRCSRAATRRAARTGTTRTSPTSCTTWPCGSSPSTARRRSRGCSAGCASATTAPRA